MERLRNKNLKVCLYLNNKYKESWIGVYLYVKEKMEHFTLIQTEKFERQYLEDMVYKLRVRYRVEHGYPTDDGYRYVEASHQFVNEFAAI